MADVSPYIRYQVWVVIGNLCLIPGGRGGCKDRQMCKPTLWEQVIIVKRSDFSAYYLFVLSVGTADGPLSILHYIG